MFELYIILTTIVVLIFIKLIMKPMRNLPPGPWGLPIVGNLLSLDPKTPHISMTEIAKKYGPICGLRMGSVYTVLLTDPKLIRQTLAKDVFSGRAPLYVTHGIMKGYGLVCAEGEFWREQRKFTANALKQIGMIKVQNNTRDELEQMISKFANKARILLEERRDENNCIDPHDILNDSVGNFLNDFLFGLTYMEDDETWKWLQHVQEEGVKYVGVAGPLNFLPFLRCLPHFRNMMRMLLGGQAKTHDIYREILKEYRESKSERASIMALFDREMKRREEMGQDLGGFNERQMPYLLADLFGAGLDTTFSTLKWILLFMAAFPDEQAKIHQEMIKSGIKDVELQHRAKLIHLEATIAEVQRIRSVVPTGIPHGALEDTKIENYDIPKDTMVVPLQWAVHMDPAFWDEPFEFRPSRFISEEGSLKKPEAFMPFQCGKRICVGEELGHMMLFLFCGKILMNFQLTMPEGVVADLEGECGITLVPKRHKYVFTKRSIDSTENSVRN